MSQTTEVLALGWVLVTPVEGPPYYANPKTQATQFDEPSELHAHREATGWRSTTELGQELVRAAESGGAEDIDRLLLQGAKVDAQDPVGVSATMKAAMAGNTAALARLLEDKPDLSLTDSEYGRTALHLAALWGHCVGDPPGGCVGMLVRAGADPEDLDGAGEKPIDLCCRELGAEVQAERQPILARLLNVLRAWAEVNKSRGVVTKLVRQGKFSTAMDRLEGMLATITETLAAGSLTEDERAEIEEMQQTTQALRVRCDFGARRREVEQQLAKAKQRPRKTTQDMDDALTQADAALLGYEELSEEAHNWPTDTTEEGWRDIEASGVAAGLEECEAVRTELLEVQVQLEEEYAAELERIEAEAALAVEEAARAEEEARQEAALAEEAAAGEERKRKLAAQLERQEKQKKREQALSEARARRAVREKAMADAKAKDDAERTAEEKAARELEEQEKEASLSYFTGLSGAASSTQRLRVRKQQRLKAQKKRVSALRAASLVEGMGGVIHMEHQREKIAYHCTRAADGITETNRLREGLTWQSPPDEWQHAVEVALEAIDTYQSAMAVLSKTPSALSEESSMDLMKAAESAHELADVLEEEANTAEDKYLAHNAVMRATGDLREHVVQKIGGSSTASAVVIGSAEAETEEQRLARVRQTLEKSPSRSQRKGRQAPQPPKPRRAGLGGGRSETANLAAQVGANVAQRQQAQAQADEGGRHRSARNEGFLRAQKSARRRIVEEVRRKAVVDQMARAIDSRGESGADGGGFYESTDASSDAFRSTGLATGASFYETQGSGGLMDMGDIGCSLGAVAPDFVRQAPPPWIDETHGATHNPAVTFRSPRQIKLQTEAAYMQEQAAKEAIAAAVAPAAASTTTLSKAAQQPSRIGIQGTASTRSFPQMLPPDLDPALYLTMQQREAALAAKEEEQRAREQGWRASMEVDPTPPEKRVYKYGDLEIKVGGRGSMIVDSTVSEFRNQRNEQEAARSGNYASQAGSWEETLREATTTTSSMSPAIGGRSLSSMSGGGGSATSGRRRRNAPGRSAAPPSDAALDR
jgi:hypothetical protein